MTRTQARQSIDKLLAALPDLGDTLRGSLLRRRTFHPPAISCATCSSGKGHSQWVLNVNYPGGKNRQLSVHPQQVALVRQQLRNLDRWRKTIERVCEINQHLLRAERKQLREQEHD